MMMMMSVDNQAGGRYVDKNSAVQMGCGIEKIRQALNGSSVHYYSLYLVPWAVFLVEQSHLFDSLLCL